MRGALRVGALLALVTVAGVGGAAAPSGGPADRGALTPARYRDQLAPVTSCAALEARWPTLPDARPLLRALFKDGLPTKNPDESDQAFVDRAVARLFDTLGDPSRVVLRLDLPGASRYDALNRTLMVRLPQPFEATLDRWGRIERRIGTGVPLVTDTALRASLDFPPDALPDAIALPMAPDAAARFAHDGRMQVLALFEDLGTDAAHHDATSGRAAVQTSYKLVRLQPKCAFFTDGAAIVAGWRFDRWAPPAP